MVAASQVLSKAAIQPRSDCVAEVRQDEVIY